MWRRKSKEPEQGSGTTRQVSRSGGPAAFSYYTNQSSPAGAGRDRLQQLEGTEQAKPKRASSIKLYKWLMIILAVICVVKVSMLGTAPKVIFVGSTPTAASYTQSESVYAAATQKILGGSVANRSKLTADLNGTARALEQQFPELQAVSLGVPLVGNRPVVYVQVARPSLIVQVGTDEYALNKSGIVLAKLQSQPSDIPLVVDQSGNRPQPGKQFLPSSTVEFMQTVAYQLSAAKLNVGVFTLPKDAPYEIDARLSGKPYYIRFNLQADALTQSGAVVATLQHLNGVDPAAYLDVRVPGRAYYK